jgi:molybdate transport repressor ModE-like protein
LSKDIEVRQCRALVAIDRAGGVAAAARELGVAQSTVSETLASLERIIGAPLTVRRSGREAVLTPAAAALLPHARAVIAASEAALSAVAGQGAGVIRLGTVESVSSFLLPRPLRTFRQRWPRVDVQISIGLCDDLRQRVKRFELDAAISIEGAAETPPADAGLVHLLSPAQLKLIIAGDHPLAKQTVSRDDLRGHSFLLADPDSAFNNLLRRWLGDFHEAPPFRSAGSIDGVKRGVLEGDAIGVLPSYAVEQELADGSLTALATVEPLPELALFLSTNSPPPWLLPLQSLFEEISATALGNTPVTHS